jgi:hypothetical protein
MTESSPLLVVDRAAAAPLGRHPAPGVAGIVAGAFSSGPGDYVSVSTRAIRADTTAERLETAAI